MEISKRDAIRNNMERTWDMSEDVGKQGKGSVIEMLPNLKITQKTSCHKREGSFVLLGPFILSLDVWACLSQLHQHLQYKHLPARF